MNLERMQGNWKQFRGKVREKWGKLTDDQLDVINGRREILAGKIQEAYGISKEEAEREIKDWEATFRPQDANADEYTEAEQTRVNARR
ncbi:MAG TPA: CsbD family protein [Steroidobacteraceae bacterium]|nr:CsbD family protein [Steroidobacteraceae bacterium]